MSTNNNQNVFADISMNLAKTCKMYSINYTSWHKNPLIFFNDDHLYVWENAALTIFVRISGSDIVLFRDEMFAHPIKVIDLNDPNSIDKLKEFIQHRFPKLGGTKASA